MSLIWADKVAEVTTTIGTGALALTGPLTGYRAFDDVMVTTDVCHYMITAVDSNGVPTGEWEAGLGTYSATDTLTRTTVHASSNAGAAVNLSAGTKRVALTQTAKVIAGWQLLTAWDFAVDGAVAEVESPVLSGYQEVMVVFNGITTGSATWRVVRVSVDGGSSYYTAVGDYRRIDTSGVETSDEAFYTHTGSSAAARSGVMTLLLTNLTPGAQIGITPTRVDPAAFFEASTSPINRIKLQPLAATTFTAGKAWILAR